MNRTRFPTCYRIIFLPALVFCVVCVPLLARNVTESTELSGTIADGLNITAATDPITISGTAAVTGVLSVNPGAGKVTFAEGSVITMNASGSDKDFWYGSNILLAGTLNINSSGETGRFRVGVSGTAKTSTLEITGALNVRTSGMFIFSAGAADNTSEAALYTQNVHVNGGTLNGATTSTMWIGSRNNVFTTITNGGTMTLNASPMLIAGGGNDWNGLEDRTVTFDVQNGTLVFLSPSAIQVNSRHGSNECTNTFKVTVGSEGELRLGNTLTLNHANSIDPTSGITLNGGKLSFQDRDISLTGKMVPVLGTGGGVVDTNGWDVTFATALSGSSLTKTGDGVLILNAVPTYTGDTLVSGGTLRLKAQVDGRFPSRNITVSPGAMLEIAVKNGTGWGNNSPNLTLQENARLDFSVTSDPWSSVMKLTMSDGVRITNSGGVATARLYVCDTASVLSGTVVSDLPIHARTTGEYSALVNAGKFNIAPGAVLKLNKGLKAWATGNKTNTLIKQGGGDMWVYEGVGTTAATPGANNTARIQVDAGRLFLYGVNDATSFVVKSGATLLMADRWMLRTRSRSKPAPASVRSTP